jgi:hypothetical protein
MEAETKGTSRAQEYGNKKEVNKGIGLTNFRGNGRVYFIAKRQFYCIEEGEQREKF